MARLKKKVIMLFAIILLIIPFSYALSVVCNPSSPLTVTIGGSYTATVTESTASEVGYGSSPATAIWQLGTTQHTFNIIASTSEQTNTYYGVARDSLGNLISDPNVKCIVTTQCSGTPNNNPTISISANPSNVLSGESTTITVTANDNEGLDFIQYFDGLNYYTHQCNDATSCINIWPGIIVNQDITFTGFVRDLCSVIAQDTTTVTVTQPNSPPSFITTQSDFDNNPAIAGQAYTMQVQASDPDGDSITYSLGGTYPGISIDSSTGLITWSSPDVTKTINVGLNDPTNPIVSQSFTITVNQCTVDQPCLNQQGVCSGSEQQCIGGQLTPASCADVYIAIPDYESPEVSCDGKDNNCDGVTDEGCACIDGTIQTISCGTGACANTATQTCVNGQWSGTCTPGTPSTELCTDTIDNDCDGTTDCSDSDCVNAAECQLCYGVSCPTNQYCNPATGSCDCSNPCTDSQKQCSTAASYEQCQTDASLCTYWGVEVSCNVNEVCSNGVCVCGSGLTDCSGSCVDLQSGPSNCGF